MTNLKYCLSALILATVIAVVAVPVACDDNKLSPEESMAVRKVRLWIVVLLNLDRSGLYFSL